MLIPFLKVLHIFGVIAWIGGLAAVVIAAASAMKPEVSTEARAAALKFAIPGMVLAWVGGLAIFAIGLDAYLAAGWMHAKITFALVASGLSGALTGKLRKASAGQDVSAGSLRGLLAGLLISAGLVLVMVFLGPIWMG